MGKLASLQSLELRNNHSLRVPGPALVREGLEAIVKDCKRRCLIESRGPAPSVEILRCGIDEEIYLPMQRHQAILTSLCENAARTGRLYLHFMGFDDIPGAVYRLGEKLHELRFVGHRMGGSTFAQSGGKLAGLRGLTVLNISANGITELPEELGSLVNLKQLFLAENSLQEIPRCLLRLFRLEDLDIAHNRLRSVQPQIKKLKQLRKLNLASNLIPEIPLSIGDLTKLTHLNLSGNQIGELPSQMGKLISLRKLNLNFNQIYQIPQSFANLGSLEILLLAANRIREIPRQIGEEADVKGEYELLKKKKKKAFKMKQQKGVEDASGGLHGNSNSAVNGLAAEGNDNSTSGDTTIITAADGAAASTTDGDNAQPVPDQDQAAHESKIDSGKDSDAHDAGNGDEPEALMADDEGTSEVGKTSAGVNGDSEQEDKSTSPYMETLKKGRRNSFKAAGKAIAFARKGARKVAVKAIGEEMTSTFAEAAEAQMIQIQAKVKERRKSLTSDTKRSSLRQRSVQRKI